MLAPDQIVGNYRITRQLGQGGMGAVYAAEHQIIGRRVAIKVLHASLSSDPAVAGRFLNEARAVNLVEHPGLVEVFEYGVLPEGGAYIVMEYLEGETLHAARRRHGRLTSEAATIGMYIAEALAAAHARDIIHRDLKPDNVMLVRDRQQPQRLRIKVLDFGIAKLVPPPGSQGNAPLTGTGVAVGTPEYMSPEQCKGKPVDGRSDGYSLGVLLYELLVGHRPFEAEFAFDLMRLHVHAPPPPLPPDVPAELAALVMDLLAKDPAQRPTMNQVVARLAPLAHPLVGVPGGPIGALSMHELRTGPIGTATPSAAVLPTLPAGLSSPARAEGPLETAPPPGDDPGSLFAANAIRPTGHGPTMRSLSLGIGVGAALVVLLGVAVQFSLRDSTQPVKPPASLSNPPSPVKPPPPLFKEIPEPAAAPGDLGEAAAARPAAKVGLGDKDDRDAQEAARGDGSEHRRQRPHGRGSRKAGAGPDSGKPSGATPFKDF